MHPKDVFRPIAVILSTLLCISAAVLPSTQAGADSAASLAAFPTTTQEPQPTKEANLTAAFTRTRVNQTLGAKPVDYNENGMMEIAANKSLSLEEDFEEDGEKDAGGDDINDEGDQIYSENENYLDNYDEDNEDQEEDENGELEDNGEEVV